MVINDPVILVDFQPRVFRMKTKAVHQYDHGLQLKVRGLDNYQQAHFANKDMVNAINVLTEYENDEL